MTETRSILITGAASGIGRGLALELSRGGHVLHLVDQSTSGLHEIASQLDGEARTYIVDLSSAESVRQLLQSLQGVGIDVLINNAGLQRVARLEEFPLEEWERMMSVMVRTPFMLMQGLIGGMRHRGFGRIINIGSIHSLVASPFKSAYVAAKHAMVGLSKVAALESADAQITVNTICPSYVRTSLVQHQIHEQAKRHGIPEEQVIERIMLEPMPMKRFIEIDEIAAAVQFLMSHAARNITGQMLVIDGGWTVK